MTDKFEEFESKIYSWVSRHKLGLMSLGLIIILWVMLSIAVVTVGGLTGWSMVEANITELHANGNEVWNDDLYNMWDSLILPIIIQMFNTMTLLILILSIGYTILFVYLLTKWWMRRDNANKIK
jgi:hypothetical protein